MLDCANPARTGQTPWDIVSLRAVCHLSVLLSLSPVNLNQANASHRRSRIRKGTHSAVSNGIRHLLCSLPSPSHYRYSILTSFLDLTLNPLLSLLDCALSRPDQNAAPSNLPSPKLTTSDAITLSTHLPLPCSGHLHLILAILPHHPTPSIHRLITTLRPATTTAPQRSAHPSAMAPQILRQPLSACRPPVPCKRRRGLRRRPGNGEFFVRHTDG